MSSSLAHEQRLLRRRDLGVVGYQPENSLLDGSYKIPPVTRVRSA
jgi:hypothetical protein